MTIYPFVKEPGAKLSEEDAREKFNPCKILLDRASMFHHDMLYRGYANLAGWRYDLRPELHRYVVKDHYCELHECWAPNKTLVRKNFGKVEYIVEVA